MNKSLLFIGFGAVHRHLARILLDKIDVLAARHGIRPRVVGVADSGGAIYQPEGLDLFALLAHKERGESVRAFPDGQSFPDALSLAQAANYDILLEASPVNLDDGEPAISCVRAALSRGRSVVLANKAPLALDFAGLHALARERGAGLAFSATVCGGLPVINVGQRDLVAAEIRRVEGIFNSTTNYILSRMAAGESYESALAEAQRRGVAETDPRLDVEGWDAANKLVIVVNAVMGASATLDDVAVQGIQEVGPAQMFEARKQGRVIKLVAQAECSGGEWRLSVAPRAVRRDSFLGGISEWQMGVVFYTDIYEEIYLKIDERGPLATSAAMLRDCVILNFQHNAEASSL
ncbi:MAG: homoserine dehydrogenase [Chloroflexi bacterium]|nr:homoserine dehydrogenase [Chloroflexota bacterium]